MESALPGTDYAQLRAFLAVAEALSFSRAAKALGITPSALSQTVRAFEESLGLQLLRRTTRSVALTEAGATLQRLAMPAIAELGAALGQARLAGGRPAGTVRLHSFRSAARDYLAPLLGEFCTAYPEILLDITLDDSVVDLVAGGFDLALRIGEVIERDMVALPLGPALRQVPAASPAYLSRYGAPAHPRDLLQHRCIRWRWPGQAHPYAWEFCEAGRWFAVEVSGPLIVNDKEMAIAAALQGVGIAFCVEEAIAEHVAGGRLVPLLEPWCETFPGIFLCYPRQRQMAPAVRAVIDALRQAARPGGRPGEVRAEATLPAAAAGVLTGA
ncbi:LysR family transcriptional regulator [Acidisoma sp. C75]